MRIIHVCLAVALLATGCTATKNDVPHEPIPFTTRVWVDTDTVVNPTVPADPDDAIALELVRRAGVNVAGVSTTSGNGHENFVWETAQKRIDWAPLHRGADGACTSDAVIALARALERGPLTILALGPLTNIAGLVRCHPDLVEAIEEVIFVGGRQPGETFWLGNGGVSFRGMRDLNFEHDTTAARRLVRAGVTLRLAPFASGEQVRLAHSELAPLIDQPLRDAVRSWAWTLAFVGGGGTIPAFDPTAAALLLWPHMFTCEPVEVRIEQNELIAELAQGDAGDAEWCRPHDGELLKQQMLALLATSGD